MQCSIANNSHHLSSPPEGGGRRAANFLPNFLLSVFLCCCIYYRVGKEGQKITEHHTKQSAASPSRPDQQTLPITANSRLETEGKFHVFTTSETERESLKVGSELTEGGNSTSRQQPQTMKPGTMYSEQLRSLRSAMKKSERLTWSAKFVEDPESSSWSDLELPSLSSITRSIGIFPFKQLMYRWQKLSHNS